MDKAKEEIESIKFQDGIIISNLGGIPFVLMWDNIFIERLYEYIGRYDYVATYTLKSGSDSYVKYGDNITGLICYTYKEREILEQSYQSRIKTYGKVRINEANNQLSNENILTLREEGIDITDIVSIYALRITSENLYIKDSIRKPHRLFIQLPPESDYLTSYRMLQYIYEGCVMNNRELCPHEWNDYLAMKLLFYPDAITEDEKQRVYDTDGNITSMIYFAMLSIKENVLGTLTDEQEIEDLEKLREEEKRNKLLVFNNELSKTITSFAKMQKVQPQQLQILLEELKNFHPIRLNTLAHRHAIYLDLEGYLHILLRHVKETSVSIKQIDQKNKLMWNFNDFKYAIKGVVGVIADDYDIKRESNKGQIYWSGKKSIEFLGDYYDLRLDANGSVKTWFRRHNSILGK